MLTSFLNGPLIEIHFVLAVEGAQRRFDGHHRMRPHALQILLWTNQTSQRVPRVSEEDWQRQDRHSSAIFVIGHGLFMPSWREWMGSCFFCHFYCIILVPWSHWSSCGCSVDSLSGIITRIFSVGPFCILCFARWSRLLTGLLCAATLFLSGCFFLSRGENWWPLVTYLLGVYSG